MFDSLKARVGEREKERKLEREKKKKRAKEERYNVSILRRLRLNVLDIYPNASLFLGHVVRNSRTKAFVYAQKKQSI